MQPAMTRRTRLAPTPSGYLHPGNCVNFLLVQERAQRIGAQIVLRIDDLDFVRSRPEYVEDIFRTLEWLGLTWDIGPQSVHEFHTRYSMALRHEYYRERFAQMSRMGLPIFACCCSRAELQAHDSVRCVRGCAQSTARAGADERAMRLQTPQGGLVSVGGQTIDLGRVHGDVIMWRRDDLPSYHLANVIEDHDLGITDIVRGIDLLESSALHIWLAQAAGLSGVRADSYVHHELVTGVSGEKLSKSQGQASPLEHSSANRRWIHQLARGLAQNP